MLDLAWSGWLPLQECLTGAAVPAEPGLYRLRADGDPVLAYVGQTGRSLRERLRALRGVYARAMPYRDPHTVAPALWAWVHATDVQLQASVAPAPGPTPMRKALEAVTIAQHRQQHQRSPRWNFGRMPTGYAMSSANNARLVAAGKRFRGGPSDAHLAAHVPGVPPTDALDPEVQAPWWCGHEWSDWQPMGPAAMRPMSSATGLYRIRGQTQGLVYVGEGKIGQRLGTHAGKLRQHTDQGQVLASCAPLEFSAGMSDQWLPHQRLELETDLIAAHTLALGRPPRAQFIG